MKTIGSLLLLFISLVGLMIIIGLAGIVSAYILEWAEDCIDNFIYKRLYKEEENETNRRR